MCHRTAPKCVDRVIRDATNSLDNVAHAARTLGPEQKGQGLGLFASTETCFLLAGVIEDEGTEASRLAVFPRVVAAPPWSRPSLRRWGLGSVLWPTGFKGDFQKAASARDPSPPDAVRACVFLTQLWLLVSRQQRSFRALDAAGQGALGSAVTSGSGHVCMP